MAQLAAAGVLALCSLEFHLLVASAGEDEMPSRVFGGDQMFLQALRLVGEAYNGVFFSDFLRAQKRSIFRISTAIELGAVTCVPDQEPILKSFASVVRWKYHALAKASGAMEVGKLARIGAYVYLAFGHFLLDDSQHELTSRKISNRFIAKARFSATRCWSRLDDLGFWEAVNGHQISRP